MYANTLTISYSGCLMMPDIVVATAKGIENEVSNVSLPDVECI